MTLVVVVFGLYVFFYHDGDFKDGGTEEKGSTKFALTGLELTTGGLLRRIMSPMLYHLNYPVPSKTGEPKKRQYKFCSYGIRTRNLLVPSHSTH